MRIFKIVWRLTKEAQKDFIQKVYVESSYGAELVERFLDTYVKHPKLMIDEVLNISEELYLRENGITQEQLIEDWKYLKEAAIKYQENGGDFQNISEDQGDMDILFGYFDCMLTDVLDLRANLGNILDEYVPELIEDTEVTVHEENKTTINVRELNKSCYVTYMK